MEQGPLAGSLFWWLKLFIIGGISIFILWLGINTLMSAYSLNNPQEFVMIFFSSSFMILLGLTGLIYPACRIHTFLRKEECKDIISD